MVSLRGGVSLEKGINKLSDDKVKVIAVSLSGFFTALIGVFFGEWTELLTTLLIVQALDVVSGFLLASDLGELSSPKMYKGLRKKFSIWIIIALCHRVDLMLLIPVKLVHVSAGAFMFNEVISIVENVGGMGVETEFLSKHLTQVKEVMDKRAEQEHSKNESDKEV